MAEYDVAVLGAGAAGMFAAIRAAELGLRVVVLEKNRRPGVKILMSGGTRCNLTNARGLRDLRGITGPIDEFYDPKLSRGVKAIQDAFRPEGGRFLGPALKAFSVEKTVAFFEGEGLATKVEGNGKIFPASDKATDVVAVLAGRMQRSGAELRLESPAQGIEARPEGGFVVRVPGGEVLARRVIVATGGLSFPGCGTTGDGFGIARSFGHTIVDPRPALVPLRIGLDWVTDLKGVTLTDAGASIVSAGSDGPILAERREAVLFAHFGLTGPAILDVSRAVARSGPDDRLDLRLDLVPGLKAEPLDQQIQQLSRTGKRGVVSLVPEGISKRLAEAVVASANIPPDRMGPDLSREERRRLVASIKGLRLPVTGTLGFAKAEVTSGGVSLDEVDPQACESKLQPGLHLIGEVLDLDGLIGGYNFQAAWSLGWLAGTVVGGMDSVSV